MQHAEVQAHVNKARNVSLAYKAGKATLAELDAAFELLRGAVDASYSRRTDAALAARKLNIANRQYLMTWRSSGSTEVLAGLDGIAARLGLKRSSVQQMLSAGKGTLRRTMLPTPDAENPDEVEIKRMA